MLAVLDEWNTDDVSTPFLAVQRFIKIPANFVARLPGSCSSGNSSYRVWESPETRFFPVPVDDIAYLDFVDEIFRSFVS